MMDRSEGSRGVRRVAGIGEAISYYTSWGRQAAFTAKECPEPRMVVDARGLRFLARCASCGWQSPLSPSEQRATRFGSWHAGKDPVPVAELIVDVAQVRRELSPELWPRDDPAWARLLVGQSVELLDVLAAMPEVLEPAIAGEQISPADEVPEDPGDASLDGLHAGWAARTNELELERVAHWATKPPDVPRLPLLRSFAADFHDFLLDRVRLHFAYLKGERLPLVERAQLQDAGFVAVTEQRRRLQEPEPAEVHLERIVLGLRARAAGIAREQG